ncbi:glycosyltransferase [Sphingomonas azotifigens]|uniref:glycosyltransferase n=1 Tax=Sphingomonas azotifigens TaxID=330920 RepID=UPI0009FC64D3|nr:glycosyltransferase [Sphingomonas azotifigens]
MRILDVCAFYSPYGGGVKTYVRRKMELGAQLGHEIIILAPGEREEILEERDGAILATIPAPLLPLDRRYRYFDDEPALHAALDRWRPDFVEASSPWRSASMVARWQGSAPRALVMHADPLAAYAYRWFGTIANRETIDKGFSSFWQHLRRLDDGFDQVVTAGRDLARRLTDGGLTKVVTIPMGVEPGYFSPNLRDESLRAELLASCGLQPESTLLIGVGRLAAEKRWPMVIEAAEAAAGRHPMGLILIGTGTARSKVIAAIGRNPHAQLFEPTSNREQLARVLASSDALVHGCEAETFCMVAAEARASGLPLIVPDQGGAADQFVEGQGMLYRAADPVSLRDALTHFVETTPMFHRMRATADAPGTRTMDQHFEELFASYQAMAYSRAA